MRRVVITGIGLITPLGNDLEATWAGLLAGKSGAAPITLFDTSQFATKFGCEVKGWDPSLFFDKREIKHIDRFLQFGVAAGMMAVADAGLPPRFSEAEADRWGSYIGAGLGGTVFDPITFLTSAGMGTVSRCVGFGLLGLATGVAIGIVESALKDRWLYVASGPLAGKQFILYKPITTIGSSQSSDIYLFKDTSILPQHGIIELRGAQTFIRSDAPVFVSGAPARNRALQSGDLIQIGRYAFHFRERQRK